MTDRRGTWLLAGLLVVLAAGPAAAEEAPSRISARLLLSIVGTPVESHQAAFDEALREPAPEPRPPQGVLLPDGSVRYGKVTVTVKNPCPPGTAHDGPPPLPGRRPRR